MSIKRNKAKVRDASHLRERKVLFTATVKRVYGGSSKQYEARACPRRASINQFNAKAWKAIDSKCATARGGTPTAAIKKALITMAKGLR